MQTSINIQPCKLSSSERHNKREKALSYVRPELSHLNEWYNTLDVHLKAYDARLRKLIKAKTGRTCQAKSHPLHEAVVVIRPDTGMADIKRLADAMSKRWGFHFVQLAVHKDEGSWKDGVWKTNYHAHMVFDKIDHTTGKTIKTTAKDTAEMQDMCAVILGMARGKKSDKKHLSALDFKIKAQEEQSKTLAAKNDFLLEAGKKRLQEVADLKEQATSQTKAIALQSILGGLAIHAAKVEQGKIVEETDENTRKLKILRSTVEFEGERLDNRRKQYESLTIKLSELQEQKEQTAKEVEKLRSEGTELEKQNNSSLRAKERMRGEISRLMHEYKELDDKIDEQKEEALKDIKNQKDTIAAEAQSLAEVVQSARSDLHELEKRKSGLQKEILIAHQERARLQREVANTPRSRNLAEAEKAGNIWRDMIYAIWENAKAAVQVLCRYLYYPHINVSFDRDEVVALNNAMKSAQTVEDRKSYGRDLVSLAHAEYPGYSDDATRLWEISRKVEEVADYSNRWFQKQDQNRSQGRGY